MAKIYAMYRKPPTGQRSSGDADILIADTELV